MARVNRVLHRQIIAIFLAGAVSLVARALTINPYPGAKVDLHQQQQRGNHPIIRSTMKKVNGVVLADETRRLDGQLNRTVYQLPDGHGSDDAYDFFVKQLKANHVETIFACNSFACGDSNFWANNIFEVARLYGMSRDQHYFVGSRIEAGSKTFYTLYTIKRGNRRVYALIDEFTAAEGSETGIQKVFNLDILPRNATRLSRTESYRSTLTALKDDETCNVVALIELAVSIPEGTDAVDRMQEQMQALTDMLEQQLKDDGIDSNRIRVIPSVLTSTAMRQPSIRFYLTR